MEEINNTYPLDNFYSYIKTNKRVSALGSSAEKSIIYGKIGNKINGKISSFAIDTNDLNTRKYGITQQNTMELENNIHFVDSTLFNITKVSIRDFIKSRSNKDISFILRDTSNPVNILTLEKSDFESETLFINGENVTNTDWNVNFKNSNNLQRIKLNINKNIELGKTNQLIKIINNSGSNYSLGDSNADNIKVEFIDTYDLDTRKKLNKVDDIYYIDYDEYSTPENKLISPSSAVSNLWLLGSKPPLINGRTDYQYDYKYWTVSEDWLNAHKSNIEYLIKPKPIFKYINIIDGQLSSTPVEYYKDVEPRGYDGVLEISNQQTLTNMGYSFENDSQYHLINESTNGEIDYDAENKNYIIKYPNGYKEALDTDDNLTAGDVLPGSGGLLNLIKKGTKITFIETRDKQIKITPVVDSNGEITKAVVECNELIFD